MGRDTAKIEGRDTHGALWGCARKYRRRGFDLEDLVQEGYVKLLKTYWQHDAARGDWNGYVRWVASSAMIHHQDSKANKLSCVALSQDDDRVAYLSYRDTPEPPDWMVALFAGMGDVQAQVVTLVCGLDGGPPRSFRDVGHIMGRSPGSVRGQYNQAAEKLRRLIRSTEVEFLRLQE